jgi:hypothetical protein
MAFSNHRNSIFHLVRSNEELKEFLKEDPGDADFLEAVSDNLKTIERKEAAKAELELEALEKGIDLTDFESKAKSSQATDATTLSNEEQLPTSPGGQAAVGEGGDEDVPMSMDAMASMEVDEMSSMDSLVQQSDAVHGSAAAATCTGASSDDGVAAAGAGIAGVAIGGDVVGGDDGGAGLYL